MACPRHPWHLRRSDGKRQALSFPSCCTHSACKQAAASMAEEAQQTHFLPASPFPAAVASCLPTSWQVTFWVQAVCVRLRLHRKETPGATGVMDPEAQARGHGVVHPDGCPDRLAEAPAAFLAWHTSKAWAMPNFPELRNSCSGHPVPDSSGQEPYMGIPAPGVPGSTSEGWGSAIPSPGPPASWVTASPSSQSPSRETGGWPRSLGSIQFLSVWPHSEESSLILPSESTSGLCQTEPGWPRGNCWTGGSGPKSWPGNSSLASWGRPPKAQRALHGWQCCGLLIDFTALFLRTNQWVTRHCYSNLYPLVTTFKSEPLIPLKHITSFHTVLEI